MVFKSYNKVKKRSVSAPRVKWWRENAAKLSKRIKIEGSWKLNGVFEGLLKRY